MLSVLVMKIGQDPYAVLSNVSVVIDPNGGTVGEQSGPYTISTLAGKWIDLPRTPVREGYVFLGWYGTPYASDDPAWTAPEEGSPDLLRPTARVCVNEDVFYTAIWKEASAE